MEQAKGRRDQVAYRAVSVPFLALGVVYLINGDVGLGAPFAAIGATFAALGWGRGADDDDEPDARQVGEERAADDGIAGERRSDP